MDWHLDRSLGHFIKIQRERCLKGTNKAFAKEKVPTRSRNGSVTSTISKSMSVLFSTTPYGCRRGHLYDAVANGERQSI